MKGKRTMIGILAAMLIASTPAYASQAVPSYAAPAAATAQAEENSGVQGFVTRLYELILGRKPDAKGLSEWTALLTSGQATGAHVASGFIYSNELKEQNLSNEDYVEVLYRTFLNRSSDSKGKAEWVNLLNKGMSRPYIYMGFVNSPEFGKICASYGINQGQATLTEPRDQNQGVTMFVYRCYEKFLGRKADDAGLNAWANVLLTGQNNAKEAASGFVFSNELKGQNLSNEDYVKRLYQGLFDREADSEGLSQWVSQLDKGVSREDVFYGFADSKEFRDLAASFGLDNSWAGTPVESIPQTPEEPSSPSMSKEDFIQLLMSKRTLWEMDDYEAKVYNGYFETGYTLMDLDFDGTLELLVNCAGGSMHNNPTAVYKVINGNLVQITEEYGLDFQGVELIYNKDLGQYCYTCDTITRGGSNGYYQGQIEYVFSGNTYTSREIYGKVVSKSFDGQESITYQIDREKVSQQAYESAVSAYDAIAEGTKWNAGFISHEEWTEFTTAEKQSALGELYDSFYYE